MVSEEGEGQAKKQVQALADHVSRALSLSDRMMAGGVIAPPAGPGLPRMRGWARYAGQGRRPVIRKALRVRR